ncbi:MAG: NAD(P) transhydrogenase subunit alpha [Candidatus Brocadiales bacterium]
MMEGSVLIGIYVFVLAIFVGIELISKVPVILHTPLMSGANAISGIILVGALVSAGNEADVRLTTVIGMVAVIFAAINVVGGYLVTDRILQMFKKRR